jgi:hypothetical protein
VDGKSSHDGSTRARLATVGSIYGVAVALNVVGMGVLGWKY